MVDQPQTQERGRFLQVTDKEGVVAITNFDHLNFKGFDDIQRDSAGNIKQIAENEKVLAGTMARKFGFGLTYVNQPLDINFIFGPKDSPLERTVLSLLAGDEEVDSEALLRRLDEPEEQYKQLYPRVLVRFKKLKDDVVGYQAAFENPIRAAVTEVFKQALDLSKMTEQDLQELRVLVVIGLPLPTIKGIDKEIRAQLLNERRSPSHASTQSDDSLKSPDKLDAGNSLKGVSFSEASSFYKKTIARLDWDQNGAPELGESFDTAQRNLLKHARKQVAARLTCPGFEKHHQTLIDLAARTVKARGLKDIEMIADKLRDVHQYIVKARQKKKV